MRLLTRRLSEPTTLFVTILIVAGMASLGGQAASALPPDVAQQDPPPIEGPVNDHGQATVSGNSISIELDDFYFEPTYIQTSPEATFTAHLHNAGTVSHTFTSSKLGIDQVLRPGERREVQISMSDNVAVFICRFHEERGMKGEFYSG